MLGYFPPSEPEELFISVLARAKKLVMPTKGAIHFAQFLIGPGKTFGWTLPNNCRAIQRGILPLSRPSDDEILAGSTYHIISPFLSPNQRTTVLTGVFNGGIGTRNTDSYRPLRYCVRCAQEDISEKRPPHWRVLPNHPAVSCCDKHRIYLVETAAVPDKYSLYDPAEWIDARVRAPEQATALEIRVAEDVRWIHANRSTSEIAEGAIGEALRAAVADLPRYRSVGRITVKRLEHDVAGHFGDALENLDPLLLSTIREHRVFEKVPVVRALLLTQFSGLTVNDLFARALAGARVPGRAERIELASNRIEELRKKRPEVTRTEIQKLEPFAYRLLVKHAPERFVSIMPVSRSMGNRKINWTQKDHEIAARFAKVVADMSTPFASIAAAAESVGISYNLVSRKSARLPKTKDAIVQHVRRRKPKERLRFCDAHARTLEAKRQLDAFRVAHPTSGRAAFSKQASWAYHVLIKCAPDLLEFIPRLNIDWDRRDDDLSKRIEGAQRELSWGIRRSASCILEHVGESKRLLSYAKGRLPRTTHLIDSLLVRGMDATDLSDAATKLAALIAANPTATRKEIWDSDPLCAGRLRRGDPELFAQLMPARLLGRRCADWENRDSEFAAKIEAALPSISHTELVSSSRIMKAAGIKPHYLLTANGRIPKTEALLASLVTPIDMLQDKRRKLEQLVQKNPGLGREQLRLLDRTTAEFLLRNDRDFYNATMPASRKVGTVQENFGDERD